VIYSNILMSSCHVSLCVNPKETVLLELLFQTSKDLMWFLVSLSLRFQDVRESEYETIIDVQQKYRSIK